MANFPDRFQKPVILESPVGNRGGEAWQQLNQRGYDIAFGLDEYYAGAVGIMGRQPHIIEYCPRDATPERFASASSTRRWLQKNGGRAVFLLLERIDDDEIDRQLAGYAWSGLSNPALAADYPITSSYRMGANHVGKGLGGAFIQTVVSTTHEMLAESRGISLETWLSNPAVNLYKKLGFMVLEQESYRKGLRPSLKPEAVNGRVEDTRLHMGYPPKLLD